MNFAGAPQVLKHSTTPEIVVEKGENVELSLVVCADPRPRVVAWEWGSLRLEAGSEMGKGDISQGKVAAPLNDLSIGLRDFLRGG